MSSEIENITSPDHPDKVLSASMLIDQYASLSQTCRIKSFLNEKGKKLHLRGLSGSSLSLVATAVFNETNKVQVLIANDRETANYLRNDLENLIGESDESFHKRKVLSFPASYKRHYDPDNTDNSNILLRTEVLKRLGNSSKPALIVTFPEALCEKVITKQLLDKATLRLHKNEVIDLDFVYDLLEANGFERTDFVIEPGQVALRGGIIDVFSYTNDHPYRIEFDDTSVVSIRSFNPETQLKIDTLEHITIVPDVQSGITVEKRQTFFEFLPESSVLWLNDTVFCLDRIEKEFEKAVEAFENLKGTLGHILPDEIFMNKAIAMRQLESLSVIEYGNQPAFKSAEEIIFNTVPQPAFNKNFDLLLENLISNTQSGYKNIIVTDNARQVDRIYSILDDLVKNREPLEAPDYASINLSLREGFIDRDLKLACYTDHQIFERYHKFKPADNFSGKQALTLKELYDLKPGDYITHIDHGVGRYEGLEIIENNGKKQEAIRIMYQNDDLLYVSIHSLHRISKYSGKDGHMPLLDRLGSNNWNKLKAKTKARVKDIARDLIKLYAQRRYSKGFAYTPDTYLQHELEASFIYEDTPDQIKSTADIKHDMEQEFPMDRLVCGDVGFGKTEIAVRAAFKAVADSKQVGILVPTTILALQHFKTFSDRLKDMPCKVDYLNRFKSAQQQKETLKKLEEGKIDIIIGTHRLLSADVKFKDLGLIIIDEEQKFGVSAKEKLKHMKLNVDALTLTATPIPRTLQFSLMGARDLSVINTPPPNRYPVQTELHTFNDEIIRDAIYYELSRGGQVFFINNRIQNLIEIAGLVQRLVPDAKIAVGHGQMEGAKLENIMLGFVEGEYDVLISTTIVESGLDIANANTIIINDAHHYGLSDLHQLRGRVGRSNKKAFCYLLAPPSSVLTDEARKRLKAIEEFSEIGSGFNIAMRDLDIRGAGNILGAEQSGFISEIGFEMYQKILDEALDELKQTDFRDLYEQTEQTEFVKDCQIETDLEILIPDWYVNVITERFSLYKELDSIENEEKLISFQENMIDRFGPVPVQTQELFNTVRLRWISKRLGFEKITLRNNLFTAYLVHDQESAYYQSQAFTDILRFVQQNPKNTRMRETSGKPVLNISNISSVVDALDTLRKIDSVGLSGN